ncbi:MAG TPA: DUF4199 family protein [Pyrinomonadaceae bacterium]|nr:DUF4199 family protein [Pyrinomonadaceae bacterium]
MKIALKYGLVVTAVVVAWIVIVRHLMGVGADSRANMIAPILFNVAQIVAIFLGMIRRKEEAGGALSFKEGLKTGVGISFVYAASACLFFVIDYLIAGPKLLMAEVGASTRPLWQDATMAFAGLFLGSLIFGVIYSTVLSFFLAKRVPRETSI